MRWEKGLPTVSKPMTVEDLHALLPKLEAFYTRFHRFFRRPERRRMGGKYLMGLTLPIERKNGEKKVQELTDKYIASVDDIAKAKEKEIMEL